VRSAAKTALNVLATVAILPALASYHLRRLVLGADRALEGSTQALALLPGLPGVYLRRAFLRQTLAYCDWTATVHVGTLFSQTGARLESNVYVGPHCHLGLVHLEADVLVAAGVHIPSGANTHALDRVDLPISQQGNTREVVRIGSGTWIGSAAVVLASVGRHSVVGAGAVVTRPVPDHVIAAGVPARVIRSRHPEAAGPPDSTSGR